MEIILVHKASYIGEEFVMCIEWFENSIIEQVANIVNSQSGPVTQQLVKETLDSIRD